MDEVAALQSKIRRLEETVDIQAEEILQLKSELVGLPDERFLTSVTAFFRMTGTESRLLQFLVDKGGGSKERIHHAIYGNTLEDPELKIVDVFVHKVRKKLNPYGITVETDWGIGYSMDPENRQKVKRLIGLATAEGADGSA